MRGQWYVLHAIERTTIRQFAEKHKLTMIVTERRTPLLDRARFYARFEHAEVKNGSMLTSQYGDGAVPEDAINAYALAISCQRLVIDSYGDSRREIEVPGLA